MFAAEVKPGQLPVQAVYEGHPLGNVDGELYGSGSIHHQPSEKKNITDCGNR